jgi:hypothetical protein
MTNHTGYLLIADVSGYTHFMTSSELDHANPIIQSLLRTLVEQIGAPMHFWKMDGDAVLSYSTAEKFPSGETFLTICENLYNAFTLQRQNIISNTTCPCKACANVSTLDLKIIAHHGAFDEVEMGPIKDISGPDVILVHRMAKSDVRKVTGISSYALFSEAAAKAMGIEEALTAYSQVFEHFGEVPMRVYDLAKAWEKFRASRDRYFLTEEDGIWTHRHHFNLSAPVVWEAITSPHLKQIWMTDMNGVSVENPAHRAGRGSAYHCAHIAVDFIYTVIDWEPFNYFSARIAHPGREGLTFAKTYELRSTETGTELRYTAGPVVDPEGHRHEDAEPDVIGFLDSFWPASVENMSKIVQADN